MPKEYRTLHARIEDETVALEAHAETVARCARALRAWLQEERRRKYRPQARTKGKAAEPREEQAA